MYVCHNTDCQTCAITNTHLAGGQLLLQLLQLLILLIQVLLRHLQGLGQLLDLSLCCTQGALQAAAHNTQQEQAGSVVIVKQCMW
jgi:hypothetical protein